MTPALNAAEGFPSCDTHTEPLVIRSGQESVVGLRTIYYVSSSSQECHGMNMYVSGFAISIRGKVSLLLACTNVQASKGECAST